MVDTTDFMNANNPYTDLPTRGQNEGLYDYLQRLATARGGMMLGQKSPVVDDVLAEEITTQPLGTLVKNVNQDNDSDGSQNNPDPEKVREQNIERAIGLATGKAVPGAQIGAALGPVGMLIGAGVDYGANTTLDKALGELGFNPDQIETLRENPNMLENLMAEGDFGFQQRGGYKPGFLDKMPSVTTLFSDIFGDGKSERVDPTTQAGWQYGAAPTLARPSNLIGMPQGMLSSGQGYIDSSGNYRDTSNLSNASIRGLNMLASVGTVPSLMSEDQGGGPGDDNSFGGGAETGAAEAAAGSDYSSNPTGYSGSF